MCIPKNRDRIGRGLLLLVAGAIFVGLIATHASAQTFVLSQNGKSVGKANLLWTRGQSGVVVTSAASIEMPGLNYRFNETVTLDSGLHLTQVQLDGNVNGTAATVHAGKSDIGSAQQFLIKIDANGSVTEQPLAYHPHAIFLPDFDPAALQTLLKMGAAHNNADMWALIPKQAGSIVPLRIATDADLQGSLDGKPISVHHFTVTGDAGKTELFASAANEILQAEWTDEGFALARSGFKLTPPVRPRSAPPEPPAQAPEQAAPTNQPPPGE